MKIDFTTAITDLDGKPIGDLTLGRMAVDALLMPFPDERDITGEEKVRRFHLAQRIHGEKAVDLSVEEVALLKRLTAKGFATLPTARAWEILDPVA